MKTRITALLLAAACKKQEKSQRKKQGADISFFIHKIFLSAENGFL